MPPAPSLTLSGPSRPPASGGRPRQIVVLCHGVGADGNDLFDIAAIWAQALPDALFLSPHAPFPCDMWPSGRQWFSLQDRSPPALEAGTRLAAGILNAWLDEQLARHELPGSALGMMGFSQGAMTALFAGLRRPVPPACILGYSGRMIGADTLQAEITGRPPVLLVHGEDDPVVPVEATRAAEAALQALGVPVTAFYREGLQHGIDQEGLIVGGGMLAESLLGRAELGA